MKAATMLLMGSISFSLYGAEKVELLHWWTSAGEKTALKVIEDEFQSLPYRVNSEPIPGGGGAPAKTTLKARAIAGVAPDIAQMEGPAIQSWAALGFLHDMEEVSQSREWDENLYPTIQSIHQYRGKYVALPLNIHRLNWMWVNQRVLDEHRLDTPTDWPALLDTLSQLKKYGVTPLALGKEQWQVVQLFENIAFGVGGADYYQRAFVDLDKSALNSPETQESLARFRSISNIVGHQLPNISWDTATQGLIAGEYAIQLTGDWALGEILNNLENGDNIQCLPFPSTESGFIYNIDSFVFFDTLTNSKERSVEIAAVLSNPRLLLDFSLKKGSIPAIKNVEVDNLSRCQKLALRDFQNAEKLGTAVPSVIDSMAVDPIVQSAVSNELYRYFTDHTLSAEEFVAHLHALSFKTAN